MGPRYDSGAYQVRHSRRPDPTGSPARPVSIGRPEIVIRPNIPYAGGDDRQRLDLYTPAEGDYPVVVFAHGGGWTAGDKAFQGNFGVFLARHGIGAAVVNYRLWPRAAHPAAAQDLAKSFAWTRSHIAAIGGDPDRVFLCGHSAGGHSAALVATDGSFLDAEGLVPGHVRGVITLSAIYKLHWNVTLYGAGPVFRGVDRAAASPHWRVGPGCPPFLVVYARKEIWTLADQAKRFHQRLVRNGCRSRLLLARGTSHSDIVSDLVQHGSEAGREIVRFVHEAGAGGPRGAYETSHSGYAPPMTLEASCAQ